MTTLESTPRTKAMEADPLASVVIICFNHGRFLAEAIESALAQTLRDVEVVVVDDGSTDDTPAVAGRFASVRYVRQENQGMAAARNAGIAASRGRYVAFLDADDRLLPEALSSGTECFRQHPESAFVSGHYLKIDAEGRPIPTEPRPCVRSDHYRVLLRENYIGMHATVLFRRDALERVGGFDRRLRACDDYDIYLRIARTQPAYCHDRTVAEYRWHGGNTSLNWRLMLRSTVGPLRAQRRYVRGNPALETEYRTGRRAWQRRYGDPLLAETLGDLRKPRRWPGAVASLATLVRYYPEGLADRLRARLSRAAARGHRVAGS
jgi:glycosyltransferase involved in cell wall biosynthesis